ncbi:MAG: hypothetical protein H0V91_15925 [Flavisolibacter sp.]|nr:hypothetical protein [Flavisolibacter sp.]
MKKLFIFIVFTSLLYACSHRQFLKSLTPYCGNSYEGKTIFPADESDPFYGKTLKIHFEGCNKNEYRIPFQVGDDRSRTWILTADNKTLTLKHDHRHADGSPDSVTMYGGVSRDPKNALTQFFPADPYTASLIPAAATNEWNLVLSNDGRTLSYILKRHNKLRFHADFDLSKPLNN